MTLFIVSSALPVQEESTFGYFCGNTQNKKEKL